MAKNLMLVLFVFVLGVVFSSAFAQDGGKKEHSLAIGARVSYANAEEALKNAVGEADEEFGYGGMIKFAVLKPVWLRFAADWFSFESSQTEWVEGIAFSGSADLDTIPLTATLLVDLGGLTGNIRPYAGAGVGYYINDIDDVSIKASAPGLEMDFAELFNYGADDAFGWHLCAGLDWFVTDNIAINLEGSYRWAEYDWDISMKPSGIVFVGEDLSESGSDHLDGWTAIAGVSFFF